MVLGLELAARPPGWNGVSSFVGKSNMPAGMVLTLPKLSVERVALPNGELPGAVADAGARAELVL